MATASVIAVKAPATSAAGGGGGAFDIDPSDSGDVTILDPNSESTTPSVSALSLSRGVSMPTDHDTEPPNGDSDSDAAHPTLALQYSIDRLHSAVQSDHEPERETQILKPKSYADRKAAVANSKSNAAASGTGSAASTAASTGASTAAAPAQAPASK